MGLAVENTHFLGSLHLGAIPGRNEERRDPGAPGTDTFRKGSLGNKFYFQLPGQELPLKLFVFTNIGSDHLFHLVLPQQDSQAEVVDPGIVGDTGQIGHVGFGQGFQAVLRDASQSETPKHHRHPAFDPLNCFISVFYNFVHINYVLMCFTQIQPVVCGPAQADSSLH